MKRTLATTAGATALVATLLSPNPSLSLAVAGLTFLFIGSRS